MDTIESLREQLDDAHRQIGELVLSHRAELRRLHAARDAERGDVEPAVRQLRAACAAARDALDLITSEKSDDPGWQALILAPITNDARIACVAAVGPGRWTKNVALLGSHRVEAHADHTETRTDE